MAIFRVPNHVLHSDVGFAPDSQNTGTPKGVFGIDDCAMLSRAISRLTLSLSGADWFVGSLVATVSVGNVSVWRSRWTLIERSMIDDFNV